MYASYITSFAILMVAVDARSRQLSNGILHAEDVGALHTDAFEKLTEMYAAKKPTGKKDMMKDSYNILTSYCDKGTSDSECEAYAKDATNEQFMLSAFGPNTKLSYPEDTLDPKLQKSLAKVNSIVAMIKKTDDIDETVFNLAAVKREVEDMKDAIEAQKLVVLSAISVASESSKLWHEVYNDPDHILHGMHSPTYFSGNKNKRRLQVGIDDNDGGNDDDDDEGMGIDIFAIIMADINGAISGAVDNINSGNPVAILVGALTSAVPASMAASPLGGDDEDDVYDYESDNDVPIEGETDDGGGNDPYLH